ncbi:DUF7146 domain-containing protein [Escherichia coli]|uniref:DUF7146 domain-containing protein n=1 Tax=Escherichia coli TaxID=562 RepID=UPI003EBE0FF7
MRSRALTGLRNCTALRFHPRCFYRGDEDDPRDRVPDAWPALIAAVTDLSGAQMGAHRTWLDLSGQDKAPVSTPRRAMGHLLGAGAGGSISIRPGSRGSAPRRTCARSRRWCSIRRSVCSNRRTSPSGAAPTRRSRSWARRSSTARRLRAT